MGTGIGSIFNFGSDQKIIRDSAITRIMFIIQSSQDQHQQIISTDTCGGNVAYSENDIILDHQHTTTAHKTFEQWL